MYIFSKDLWQAVKNATVIHDPFPAENIVSDTYWILRILSSCWYVCSYLTSRCWFGYTLNNRWLHQPHDPNDPLNSKRLHFTVYRYCIPALSSSISISATNNYIDPIRLPVIRPCSWCHQSSSFLNSLTTRRGVWYYVLHADTSYSTRSQNYLLE